MNIIGVRMLATYVRGERRAKSAGSSKGALWNHVGLKSVKSAVYQKLAQSEMSRWLTAALNLFVCVTTQLVKRPPPLPPVTPMREGSTYPFFRISSTPAIKSL